MADFSGKWSFDHGENMEFLVEKLKIDPAKIPSDKSTTVVIAQNGDTFNIKTTTAGGKTRDITYKIGQSFIDPDIKELRGKEIEVTPSWEGSKLVLAGPKGNSASREIVGSQMVVTFNWEGQAGKRFFNRA
nr:retinoid-binding protein 7-like [Lytechinus pictus]